MVDGVLLWSMRSKGRSADAFRHPQGAGAKSETDRRRQQDRSPGARPDYVVNATFDLFDKLGASEEAARFP